MAGEYIGRTAAIGPPHHGDGQRRQLQAGICGLDPGIVPLGDFAKEDVGVDIPGQLQALRVAWEVVGNYDFARRHRQQDRAALHLGDFLGLHGCVTGRKVNGAVDEVQHTCATAFGLIINIGVLVFSAEVFKPRGIQRERETGPGTRQPQPLLGKYWSGEK